MALRSEAFAGVLMMAALPVWGSEFSVAHVHLRKDQPGLLSITAEGIEYREKKQHKKPHEYKWAWNDIQKLVLSPERIEIRTYKDVGWQFGRDREFEFRGKGLDAAYALLAGKLPRRLVPEVAPVEFEPAVRIPAKHLDGASSGHEGTLLIGEDRIVFDSAGRGGAHTWVLAEVDNVSSADPLEFTISSLGEDYRLQLKQPLPEAVYNDLWRKLNIRRVNQ